jgi:deoxyribose-phosphate aldolase
MVNIEEKYDLDVNQKEISDKLEDISRRSGTMRDKELFRKIFSLIDLTSLDVSDTEERILGMVDKVNKLHSKFSEIPNVAALCVYPIFIPAVKANLKAKSVKIASVAASFPSSQTFTDIKLKEVERVIQEGADEVDIVMPVGKFLEGKYEYIFTEIQKIKGIIGNAHLKVILETGALKEPEKIKRASFLCLEAGADFIKTSTGKTEPGATPMAVYVMCEAIKEFHKQTGIAAGIKPAGGISDADTAIQYYLIVNEVLGNDWIKPGLFRIGASRLANNLLGEKYF